MKWCINQMVRLVLAGKQAYTRKWDFLGVFVVVSFGSVAILGWLDLLPEKSSKSVVPIVILEVKPVATEVATVESPKSVVPAVSASSKSVTTAGSPIKILIPSINLSVTVQNPTSLDAEVLDRGLLKGAVRYPTSAKLGEKGNMVIFGHSSYLPIVHNQAYKTFNGIQNLSPGDVVVVYSSSRTYTYKIRNVERESANNGGISLLVTGSVLTLATCDSFGKKTDRFVVTADFVESHSTST